MTASGPLPPVPPEADFGSRPAGGSAPLGVMSLVLALVSFLVPGGLLAIPALYLAGVTRKREGSSSLVVTAQVLAVLSVVAWAVVGAVLLARR